MPTYIALFRGINIGGNNPLPMRDLVGILERMGCKDVQTYIQSGNAVFRIGNGQRKKIVDEMGARILKAHGFWPKVLMLSVSELQKAIDNNPFSTAEGRALHFLFLESEPRKPDLARLMEVKSKSEEFRLDNKVFYLYAPKGVGQSKLVARIESSLGVAVTGRNWNTVNKLFSMAKKAC